MSLVETTHDKGDDPDVYACLHCRKSNLFRLGISPPDTVQEIGSNQGVYCCPDFGNHLAARIVRSLQTPRLLGEEWDYCDENGDNQQDDDESFSCFFLSMTICPPFN